MKSLFTITLALSVLFQSLSAAVILARFQLQKKYIAEKLCENRNNPQTGCAGKCYLKKLLKKADEAEKALPGSIKEKMQEVCTLQDPFIFEPNPNILKTPADYYFSYFLPSSSAESSLDPPRS